MGCERGTHNMCIRYCIMRPQIILTRGDFAFVQHHQHTHTRQYALLAIPAVRGHRKILCHMGRYKSKPPHRTPALPPLRCCDVCDWLRRLTDDRSQCHVMRCDVMWGGTMPAGCVSVSGGMGGERSRGGPYEGRRARFRAHQPRPTAIHVAPLTAGKARATVRAVVKATSLGAVCSSSSRFCSSCHKNRNP